MRTCDSCRYAVEDMTTKGWEWVGDKWRSWVGVECSNPDSEYHLALLNITASGSAQAEVTWRGCEHHRGKGRVARFENISE